MSLNGSQAFLHMLAESGVKHLFGNPGTTELPLNDALVDHPRIQYILGLQEVPVMAIADGYAQASRHVGVVNLHISCGLGHAMGILYNAHRSGTPLVVTAGQQHRKLKFAEPLLWSDLVQVARPYTKWAVEVERAEDIPMAVRRAVSRALTPPTGPVFLSIPVDVQQEIAEFDLTSQPAVDYRVRPPVEALVQASEVLAQAKNPAILAGSRIVEADGVTELVAVAELLGAPVLADPATTHGRLSFPCDHPLSAPGLPPYSPEIRERLDEFDVLFVAGMDLFQLYVYFEPEHPIPDHLRIVHLDQNAREIGKNYPTEVGVFGDPKAGLAELAEILGNELSEEQRAANRQRSEARTVLHQKLREELIAQAASECEERPVTPTTLMASLARALPPEAAVVEEAVTTTNTVLERLGAIKDPSGYFAHRGWALGWGLGCSIGVQLAWPDRPVLGVIGEGASMYGIQGLWTAARYKIPVTWVICNNSQYNILKLGAKAMQLERATQDRFEGMDIAGPEIDFVSLAKSFGIQAERVTEPEELTHKVKESLAGDTPRLFDVPIRRTTPTM